MAAFAGKYLKVWREQQNVTAAELAEKLSCDVTTIYRYESEKMKANPDVMYEICKELGNVSRWCDWMRSEFPTSYGVVHPELPNISVPSALMMLYAIIGDVQEQQRQVLRSGAYGVIEESLKHELEELIGTSQLILNKMYCTKGVS